MSIPLEKLNSFNSFEQEIPCKIEVETLAGNLETIDVTFEMFWQAKRRASALIHDVEKFNF